MKVFTCTSFTGHYPVGVSALIVAETEDEARTMLLEELRKEGLPQKHKIYLTEIALEEKKAIVLQNGDY